MTRCCVAVEMGMDPLVQVDPVIEQTVTETMNQSDGGVRIVANVEEFLSHRDYKSAAQVLEYFHRYYDFEKRKDLLPALAGTVKRHLAEAPVDDKLLLLRSLGRAAFVFDEIAVFPSFDLAAVTDLMLTAADSTKASVRTEAYFWLARAAPADSVRPGILRKWAEARGRAIRATLALQIPGSNDLFFEIDPVDLVERIARSHWHPALYCRDNEIPRLENMNAREIAALIDELGDTSADVSKKRIVEYVRPRLAHRTSPSEIEFVLNYEISKRDFQSLRETVEWCFRHGGESIDESRRITRKFLVSNLAEFGSQTESAKSLVDMLAGMYFQRHVVRVFDLESSQQIFGSVTPHWPMPQSEWRLRTYQMLTMLHKFGEGVGDEIAAFAKRADEYERSASYNDEKARQRALDLLKPLLLPEPNKPLKE